MEEIKRRCRNCGKVKPLAEFHKNWRSKNGRLRICKECRVEENKQYHKENREHDLEQKRSYYYANREQRLEARRQYRRDHREQILEREKRNYIKNHDQIIEKRRQHRLTEEGKIYIARCRHKRRAREKAVKADLTSDQWERILKNQRYKCNLCGKKFTKTRLATVDHIIPLSKGGGLTSDNVQALCRSCNSSKHAKLQKRYITTWCL